MVDRRFRYRLRSLLLLVFIVALALGGWIWTTRMLQRRKDYLNWSLYCEVRQQEFYTLAYGDALLPSLLDPEMEAEDDSQLTQSQVLAFMRRRKELHCQRAEYLANYFHRMKLRFSYAAPRPWLDVRFDPVPAELEVAANIRHLDTRAHPPPAILHP